MSHLTDDAQPGDHCKLSLPPALPPIFPLPSTCRLQMSTRVQNRVGEHKRSPSTWTAVSVLSPVRRSQGKMRCTTAPSVRPTAWQPRSWISGGFHPSWYVTVLPLKEQKSGRKERNHEQIAVFVIFENKILPAADLKTFSLCKGFYIAHRDELFYRYMPAPISKEHTAYRERERSYRPVTAVQCNM